MKDEDSNHGEGGGAVGSDHASGGDSLDSLDRPSSPDQNLTLEPVQPTEKRTLTYEFVTPTPESIGNNIGLRNIQLNKIRYAWFCRHQTGENNWHTYCAPCIVLHLDMDKICCFKSLDRKDLCEVGERMTIGALKIHQKKLKQARRDKEKGKLSQPTKHLDMEIKDQDDANRMMREAVSKSAAKMAAKIGATQSVLAGTPPKMARRDQYGQVVQQWPYQIPRDNSFASTSTSDYNYNATSYRQPDSYSESSSSGSAGRSNSSYEQYDNRAAQYGQVDYYSSGQGDQQPAAQQQQYQPDRYAVSMPYHRPQIYDPYQHVKNEPTPIVIDEQPLAVSTPDPIVVKPNRFQPNRMVTRHTTPIKHRIELGEEKDHTLTLDYELDHDLARFYSVQALDKQLKKNLTQLMDRELTYVVLCQGEPSLGRGVIDRIMRRIDERFAEIQDYMRMYHSIWVTLPRTRTLKISCANYLLAHSPLPVRALKPAVHPLTGEPAATKESTVTVTEEEACYLEQLLRVLINNISTQITVSTAIREDLEACIPGKAINSAVKGLDLMDKLIEKNVDTAVELIVRIVFKRRRQEIQDMAQSGKAWGELEMIQLATRPITTRTSLL